MTPSRRAEERPALVRHPDGTIEQWNPLTGETVFSVPDRAARPRMHAGGGSNGDCDFCPGHERRTTPEKARVTLDEGGGWRIERDVGPRRAFRDRPLARRVGNLYAILGWGYWRERHGRKPTETELARQRNWLAEPEGRDHVAGLLETIERTTGRRPPGDTLEERSIGLFAGSHDLVVFGEHARPDPLGAPAPLGSGSLTAEEHRAYIALTLASARAIEAANPSVADVAVFQNWLAPAGASFEHLHKQLLGVDRIGPVLERKAAFLARDPGALHERARAMGREAGLVVCASDVAAAWVDPGHAHPTVTITLAADGRTAPLATRLEDLSATATEALADVLHAVHIAFGPTRPSNEEWQQRPRSVRVPVPVHVHVRARGHTPAGFEGATGLHVSTIDPAAFRDDLVARLEEASERISPAVAVGQAALAHLVS